MPYVDGFVLAVPADKREQYVESAAKFATIVKEWGATRVVECWGDDVPEGKVTDFLRAVKAEAGEVVVFSWIEYPSKEVREAVQQKMRTDERMKNMPSVFDGQRMIYGGFQQVMER